jgi:hypothetical protein
MEELQACVAQLQRADDKTQALFTLLESELQVIHRALDSLSPVEQPRNSRWVGFGCALFFLGLLILTTLLLPSRIA